ncbi:MAG: hypothetical protein QM767_03830 [Anaeromyxobacter sp.]
MLDNHQSRAGIDQLVANSVLMRSTSLGCRPVVGSSSTILSPASDGDAVQMPRQQQTLLLAARQRVERLTDRGVAEADALKPAHGDHDRRVIGEQLGDAGGGAS